MEEFDEDGDGEIDYQGMLPEPNSSWPVSALPRALSELFLSLLPCRVCSPVKEGAAAIAAGGKAEEIWRPGFGNCALV